MNNITVKTLENIELNRIYKCWCTAFADYKYKFNMSKDEFNIRLAQDSFDPTISVGAFLDNRLIGFWLSGLRLINGHKTAYDAGTAILPMYRGQNIGDNLYKKLCDLLSTNQIYKYIIEVFTDNTPALNLYLKNGFRKVRKLNGYRIPKQHYSRLKNVNKYSIETPSFEKLTKSYLDLLEYQPSWQNSLQALNEVKLLTIPLLIKKKRETLGFAIYQPILGRIAQVGFTKEQYTDDIFKIILNKISDIKNDKEHIEIINIDPTNTAICEKISRLGFEHFVTQYELIKEY